MLALMIVAAIILLLISSRLVEAQQHSPVDVDMAVFDDHILAYHLDWEILHAEQFRLYHFVKQVNASRRYAELTGVSYQQAWAAIQGIRVNNKRKIRRLDDILTNEQDDIRRLLDAGDVESAAQRLAESSGVDKFTAHEALLYMQGNLRE